MPNGEVAPPAPAVPDAAPAPAAAAPAAAPAAPAAAPAAPAAAPAAGQAVARLRRPPAGLPGPRRRPVLRAAQLLGTDTQTGQLLADLPTVEHLCRRGQRQHQRLLQTNWVYMLVFVYTAFIYRAAIMSRRFGGAFIGEWLAQFRLLTVSVCYTLNNRILRAMLSLEM